MEEFQNNFFRPLFIINFRTKILLSGPYSILTGHTNVESVQCSGVLGVQAYVMAKVYWRIKYTLAYNLEAKVYFSPKLQTWRLMCTLSPNLEARV